MATQTNKTDFLRELTNKVEIIGTLVSMDLTKRTSKKGNVFIAGKLVVRSMYEGKINEIPVKVMVMGTSKLFKGIETVMNTYKAVDTHGEGDADKISVFGILDFNEYYNGQGKLIQFNEIKGNLFKRVDKNTKDLTLANVDVVVQGFAPVLDSEQLPTGDYLVKGFTVGWGNNVIELRKALVKADIAQSFMNAYLQNSTGTLKMKINNYVEIVQSEQQQEVIAHGFGSNEQMSPRIIEKHTNNLLIIGGSMPHEEPKAYSAEEIEKALQVRNLKSAELQAPAEDTPPTQHGFGSEGTTESTGSNNENQPPTGMGGEGMPDF